MEAVAALQAAGLAADPAAPASAAHWFAAALRLLPADADATSPARPAARCTRGALAQTASSPAAARRCSRRCGSRRPDFPLRGADDRACATMERLLGRHAEARARVERALDALPDRGVPEAVLLMMELAADGFFADRLERMWEWARKAHRGRARARRPADRWPRARR